MDERELNQKISELKKHMQKDDVKRASLLLTLILTTMGVIAGGVILGALFERMALSVMTAIFACIPLEATKFMEYRELCDKNNRYKDQIASYENEIEIIRERSKTNNIGYTKTKDAPTQKQTKKYEYKKNNDKRETTGKKQDIPIEFFDENDFSEEQDENNHKTR